MAQTAPVSETNPRIAASRDEEDALNEPERYSDGDEHSHPMVGEENESMDTNELSATFEEPVDADAGCFGYPPLSQLPLWYFARLTGYDQSKNQYGLFLSWDLLIAFVFVCITMVVLGIIQFYGFEPLGKSLSTFIPAFGASSTVLFAVPKAPIAQPRALFMSHISGAIIGVAITNAMQTVAQPLGVDLAGAIAVALHLAFMQATNCIHPPASATAISAATAPIDAYYYDRGFLFVVLPVMLGCCVLFVLAWLLNNIFAHRSPYPQYWW